MGVVAYEVYRAWDEVKAALLAVWELLEANATQLGLYISIAFEEMKSVVLNAVDAMIDKLGILEKLPFGLGDKFKGLKDAVAESADASEARIAELQQKLEENSERIQVALEGTKVAFGDLGTKIADDVKGVISAITGQTDAIEQSQTQQTAIIEEQSALRTDILNDEINQQIQTIYDGMTAIVDSWIQAGYDSEGDVRGWRRPSLRGWPTISSVSHRQRRVRSPTSTRAAGESSRHGPRASHRASPRWRSRLAQWQL